MYRVCILYVCTSVDVDLDVFERVCVSKWLHHGVLNLKVACYLAKA